MTASILFLTSVMTDLTYIINNKLDKIYRTVKRPIVTYASETWVLKETVIQKY
jgi:hypothetical protein